MLALLASILIGIPAASGVENWAGRTMTNLLGWEDTQISFFAAYKSAHLAGGPDFAAFPAASDAFAWLFDDASAACVDGNIQLWHSYNPGTPIKCHIHWAPISNSTNAVNWQLDYTISGVGVAISSSGMLDISTAGSGTTYMHQMAEFADIACTTCTISSVMLARICRDGNGTNGTDDMVGDVAGLYFDCHQPLSSLGSATYNAK
jgi:hypothetical protein